MMKALMLSTAKVDKHAGGHGNRWDVFEGGTDAILNQLGMIVEKAEMLDIGMAIEAETKAVIAAGEPQGILLLYTGKEKGTSMTGAMAVVHVDTSGADRKPKNALWSAYPFFGDGVVEVDGIVESLHLHSNRLEAGLSIELPSIDGCLISAFDPLFCLHRALYRERESYRFLVSALAYSMKSAQGIGHVIDDPHEIRRFRAHRAWVEEHGQWTQEDEAASLVAWQPQTPEDMEPIRFDMSRGTMLLPSYENGPADDATYMGEVVRVTPDAVNILNTHFWRVDVIVLRREDEEISTLTVPIYVAENLFEEGWRPAVGDYVTGRLWLQAYVKPDMRISPERSLQKKFELSTDDMDERYPSWEFTEATLRKTHGYFFSEKDKKEYGKYCILAFVADPENYIQTAYQRDEAGESWRLERRDWHSDGSWTHYYARLATDNEDANMIENLDSVIEAFKAFYYSKPLPEDLLWVEYDIPKE
ncbi:MAG: hypothetical protein LBV44_03430 [Methylobacillus sp.]|jgi:hypothetical protein|nr:hypothetical protein [Methylobacillus sp.]